MTDEETMEDLVREVFDVEYNCSVKPVVMDVAFRPEQEEVVVLAPTFDPGPGCYHSAESLNEDIIMDAMFGHTAYSGDEEDDEIKANTPIGVNISPASMAMILDVDGTFTFNNPKDATKVMDVLDVYARRVEVERQHQIHYQGPPLEDMQKLAKLASCIRPLAKAVRVIGKGSGEWAEIQALFGITGNYVVGEENAEYDQFGEVTTVSAKPPGDGYHTPHMDLGNGLDYKDNLPDPYKLGND